MDYLINSIDRLMGSDWHLESDELPFAEGDVIRVLQVQDDGWWLGYLVEDPACMGLFPSNYVQQQRVVEPEKSVLQLKQSLLKAERARAAAKEARLEVVALIATIHALFRLTHVLKQAERSRRWRQRRHWEENESDEQEQDEEEQEDKDSEEEYDDENDPEDDDNDNFQDNGELELSETAHNQQSAREEFPSSEEEEDEPARPKEAGSFSILSEQRYMMNEVIDAYQARKHGDVRVNSSRAASRIARQYRLHRQDQQLRRNASRIIVDSLHRNVTTRRSHRSRELQQRRQQEAARFIQLWIRHRLDDRQRDRLALYQRQEEDVAVRRLQRCARRLLLRNAVRKGQIEQVEQRQAVIEQQDSEPTEPSDNEETGRLDQEAQSLQLQREQELIEQEHKKKVMKKEARDLIKVLVNKQLETRLRDHDAKMLELQQLVTTLQDVVRTQSAMIRQSSDTILELEQAAAEVAAERSPQMIQRSNSIQSLKQKTMASQLQEPSPTSAAASLPALTKPQIVRTGSGIKPPRSIDIPSKLPAITPHSRPNPTRPRVRN